MIVRLKATREDLLFRDEMKRHRKQGILTEEDYRRRMLALFDRMRRRAEDGDAA